MSAKRLSAAAFVSASAVLCCLWSPSAAREISSPGFEAAWADVQEDGRIFYHCLVDLRNCNAGELDLVVQFRRAAIDDVNVKERGNDQALMLFLQTWKRPAEAAAGAERWEPDPVELSPRVFERADLAPGTHDIDAIFDLYDAKARSYVAGGWPWRLALRVVISAGGKAVVSPYLPNDMFPLFRDSRREATPPIIQRSAQIAGNEALPEELAGYGLKPLRIFGTMRLRHGEDLSQVAFTKNGSTIVSVGVDNSICFWDSDRGTLKGLLKGTALQASDGTLLVLSSERTPEAVDPATGRKLCSVQDAPAEILAKALSADARQLVLLSENAIGQWDLASGKRVAQKDVAFEKKPQAKVTGSISRCGRFAALACNEGKKNFVTVFEVSVGRRVLSTVIDHGVAPPVVVCAGGKFLALPEPQRSGKHSIAIFDAATGEKLRTFEIGYREHSLAVSPDGAVMAVVDDDSLVLYDPSTGQARRLPGVAAESLQRAFLPDGRYLMIAGNKGIKIVEVSSGNTVAQRDRPVHVVAFSADGKRIVSGSLGGVLAVCDAQTGADVLGVVGLGQPVCGLAVSANGQRLAACSELGECRVWNLASGLPVFSVHAHQTRGTNSAHLDLSPDGTRMVTSGTGGSDPLVWDVEKGRVLMPLAVGGVGAGPGAFSPDGRYVAACHHAGPESALCVWDLSTREPVLRDRCLAAGVAFSRDGKSMAVAQRDDKSILQYDWVRRQPGGKVKLPDAPEGLAYSGDGKLIASAGQILDAQTGQVVAEHEKLSTTEVGYLFAPDGRHLLAVADGKLHLFDASTGKRVKTVEGPWAITAAVFGADGKTFLTGLSSGAVVAWQWQL